MKISVDHSAAEMLVERLNRAFTARQGLLAEVDDLVENQVPLGVVAASGEHARFLFYTVPQDHGMRSRLLYTRAKALYALDPEMFAARGVLIRFNGPDDQELVDRLGDALGVRYPREAAKSWFLNSQLLLKLYEGEPAAVLRSSSSAGDLLRAICQFRGFGPKTGGMMLRAAVGLGLARVDGLEEVLLPVDIHDTRIAFFTGIVSAEPGWLPADAEYYGFVPAVQRVLLDACNARGIQWLDVDRALWIIGSRGCAARRCHLCPLRESCVVGQQVLGDESG